MSWMTHLRAFTIYEFRERGVRGDGWGRGQQVKRRALHTTVLGGGYIYVKGKSRAINHGQRVGGSRNSPHL